MSSRVEQSKQNLKFLNIFLIKKLKDVSLNIKLSLLDVIFAQSTGVLHWAKLQEEEKHSSEQYVSKIKTNS